MTSSDLYPLSVWRGQRGTHTHSTRTMAQTSKIPTVSLMLALPLLCVQTTEKLRGSHRDIAHLALSVLNCHPVSLRPLSQCHLLPDCSHWHHAASQSEVHI